MTTELDGRKFAKYKGKCIEEQMNGTNSRNLKRIIEEIESNNESNILKEDLPYMKYILQKKLKEEKNDSNKFESKDGKLFIKGKEVLRGWESYSGWYWFATEKVQVQEDEFSDHDQIWYGFVQGLEEEWGDFSQAEIESLGKNKVWEIPKENLSFSGRRN